MSAFVWGGVSSHPLRPELLAEARGQLSLPTIQALLAEACAVIDKAGIFEGRAAGVRSSYLEGSYEMHRILRRSTAGQGAYLERWSAQG